MSLFFKSIRGGSLRTIKNPDERRREIVMAATELFMEDGYEKTTIENIINKVGISKGGFYHYFPSKKEIFQECIASLSHSILNAYLNIFGVKNKNAKQKLLDYIDYNFQLVEQESSKNLIESIHTEIFEKMHEQILKDTVKKFMPSFIRLIEQGKIEGDFNVENAEFTAAALLGALQEIHILFSYSSNKDRDKQRKWILALMERILQTKFS